MNESPDDLAWLEGFLRGHGGVAGTVHVRPPDGDLELVAAVNIPLAVQEIVRRIPLGKGMAGLAWERNEPVSTCNIKDDRSGQVRPGAKAIDAGAGVALPVRDALGRVRAVVGIAYEERTLDAAELRALEADAAALPARRESGTPCLPHASGAGRGNPHRDARPSGRLPEMSRPFPDVSSCNEGIHGE